MNRIYYEGEAKKTLDWNPEGRRENQKSRVTEYLRQNRIDNFTKAGHGFHKPMEEVVTISTTYNNMGRQLVL